MNVISIYMSENYIVLYIAAFYTNILYTRCVHKKLGIYFVYKYYIQLICFMTGFAMYYNITVTRGPNF